MSKMETTQSKSIPSDWQTVKLEAISDISSGGSAPQGEQYFNGENPFIRVQHVEEDTNRITRWDLITDEAVKKYKLKLYPRGTIVFPKSGASIYLEKRAMLPLDSYIVSHLCAINADNKQADQEFLFYELRNINLAENKADGYPTLNLSEVKIVEITLPPLPEQHKISSVLSKIQQAIEQQGKILQITKGLKKSLMNKFFTEGLHGEEQKETEVGLIPKSWDVKPAEEMCERVTDGTHDSPKPAETGYNLVTSKNLKDGKILFDGCYLIKEEDYFVVNKRSKVDLYDVVFGMIGTLGSPVIIRKEPDFAIKNVGLFKTGKNKDLGLWLYYYLSSDSVERLVDKQKAGATQKYIPLWFLRQLPIPVPSEKERDDITKILEDISLKLDAEENRLITMKNLFKTMLNQLMTGRVRVKNLDIGVN